MKRNPNVPGQKLKVQIPKNADMEKRRFVVSIPTPNVTEPVEIRENTFKKEFREALCNYSYVFDDWCIAEGSFVDTCCFSFRSLFSMILVLELQWAVSFKAIPLSDIAVVIYPYI